MFKLYARTGAGSTAVEALFAELGLAFERVDVPRNPDGSIPDWFIAINPRGEVPSLELPDHSVMTESAAMMIYLADLHPEKGLAPLPTDPDRAAYLRWMVYLAAAPYTSDLRMYYPQRYSMDAAHAEGIKAKAVIDLNRDFDVMAGSLGSGPFILGTRFSAVDLYAAMLLSWSDDMTALFQRQPRLAALYDAVAARPAVRSAWQLNKMPVS